MERSQKVTTGKLLEGCRRIEVRNGGGRKKRKYFELQNEYRKEERIGGYIRKKVFRK